MSVVQSEYVRDVLAAVPEPVSYLSAKRSRDVLMTVLLVRCAGRPSHVTGLTMENLREAKVCGMILG